MKICDRLRSLWQALLTLYAKAKSEGTASGRGTAAIKLAEAPFAQSVPKVSASTSLEPAAYVRANKEIGYTALRPKAVKAKGGRLAGEKISKKFKPIGILQLVIV